MATRRARKSAKAHDAPDVAPEPGTYTLDQIAGIFRVTEKAIRDWIRAGMPVEVLGAQGRGKKTAIKLESAVRWYFQTNHEGLELDRKRAALADEQRETAALRNAEARGDLASISAMAKQFSDAVAVAQALLLSIPTKEAPALAPLTDANAIESRLRKAIYEALQQLSEYGSRGVIESRSRGRQRNGSVRATSLGDGQ